MPSDDTALILAEEVLRLQSPNGDDSAADLMDRGLMDLGLASSHLPGLLDFIEQTFGPRLAVTDFFDHPTIGQLAQHIDDCARGRAHARG